MLADAARTGSVPAFYHQYLGPLYFAPYARDLVRRIPKTPGARVLELACGTGILTSELVASFDESATITAIDLNEGMIDIARRHSTSACVRWKTADATHLPFEDRAFDLAVCQFGVMFFPDKIAAAHQVRRVLRDGGQWWFSVWGTLAENPLARVTHETVAGFFGSDPPTFYDVPFEYADARRISDDLRRGGFADVTVEAVDLEGHAPSAEHAAIGLVLGNPVVHAIRERRTVAPEEVVEGVAAALAREFGRGEIRFPMRAHVVTAQ
jgi:SAM-dependent methyltransferase